MNSTGDVWTASFLGAIAAVVLLVLVVILTAIDNWIDRNKKDSNEPNR